MATTTLKVDFVNPPKPGKKLWTIKCGAQYFYYDGEKFHFTKGQNYTFDYTVSEYQGKNYSNVTNVHPGPPAEAAAPSQSSGGNWSAEKEERVTRLAIAKSCIESNSSTDVADTWLDWVKNEGP